MNLNTVFNTFSTNIVKDLMNPLKILQTNLDFKSMAFLCFEDMLI